MIRILVGNKVSFYPIIGEKGLQMSKFGSDSALNLHRSETPQFSRMSLSTPTSPHHSLTMTRY